MIRIIGCLVFFITLGFAQDLQKVSLQLNWKYQFEFAGFIAAKELGFYEEVGLDVDIKEFTKDVNVVEDVLNQKVDFGVYSASLIRSYDEKRPLVFLANYFKRSPLVFITKQSIITPQDLVGKKIMAAPNELHHSSLGTLLEKFKIKEQDFVTLPHSFSADEFISGNVDVMTAYISNEPFHLQQKRIPYNIIDPNNYGVYGLGVNLFTSKEKTIKEKEQVQKFIQATNKGWAYALENKEKIVELIYEKYSKAKSKEALHFEAIETQKLMMPKIYPIGFIDKNVLEDTISSLQEDKLLNTSLTTKELLFDANISNTSGLVLSKKEKVYLDKKESITMCIDPDWMPYEKLVNGKHIGMTADFFPLLEQKIGIPINLVPTISWPQSIEFAKQRKCDIFSLAMPTPSRIKYMDFTRPYIDFPLVIATKTDKLFITDAERIIQQEHVGIVKGYAIAELLKEKYPNHKIIDVSTVEEGLDMVEQGKIFGFVGALPTVAYTLQRKYITSLKIAGKFDRNLELGIGVRNDEPILKDIFEKAIASIDDTSKQSILNKYISVTFEKGVDYDLLWKLTLAVFVLALFGIYRHKQLLKHNEELTLQKSKLNEANEELLVTQKQLQTSLNSFEVLLNSAMEAIFVYENRVCIDANRVAVKMFGYESKEQMIGLMVDDFAHQESIHQINDNFMHDVTAYEVKAIRKNGEVFDFLVQGKNTQLNGRDVRISSGIDITEMKNQERLIFQQSKLAAMGEMIDNIAHQWRQPLSVISSISTGLCLQFELPNLDKEEAVKDLNKLNKTSQYLSETIDDFRNFFRRNKIKREFSILDAVQKNLTLIDGILKNNGIKVIFEKVDEVRIESYENELTQALLNIFHNAKDAMKDKESPLIFISIVKDTEHVILKICDNGGGIDKKIREKVFEPYFTTKHQSQGTGIGLYMTHQIIESHMHGTIKVNNRKFTHEDQSMKGAEFTITLPLS